MCLASLVLLVQQLKSVTGQAHSRQGYIIIAIAAILTTIDLLSILRRIYAFLRSGEKFGIQTFWNATILGRDETWLKGSASAPEYVGLVSQEDASDDDAKDVSNTAFSNRYERLDHLGEGHLDVPTGKFTGIRRIGNILFVIVESALVIAGFAQVVLGIVVYTGAYLPLFKMPGY